MRSFIRIPLLIFGLIVGAMTAYSLGKENKLKTKDINELNTAMQLFGKGDLDSKKSFISKITSFSSIVFIVYTLITMYYFYPIMNAFILSTSLLLFEVIDYVLNVRRIKKATKIEDIMKSSTRSKIISTWYMIAIAIQIGLML